MKNTKKKDYVLKKTKKHKSNKRKKDVLKKTKTRKTKKTKKRLQIKSGAQGASSWFQKPQFLKDLSETIKIASNIPQTIQNQMTIYLYGIRDIDTILITEGTEGYVERNDKKRIKGIITQLKRSALFNKHMQKREYGFGDSISSEELWQIIQEEAIAKIINDFMKRSLEYQR